MLPHAGPLVGPGSFINPSFNGVQVTFCYPHRAFFAKSQKKKKIFVETQGWELGHETWVVVSAYIGV
jgi:hypothetical protein